MKTLKLGMRDAAVKILQTELNRIGNKLTADGAFGPGTLAAVKAFQQSLQLVADGIVGYSTWQALFFHQRPAAARLTEDGFRLAALLLDCETAALKSVQKVETAGRGGFLAAGKPQLLFEGHIFWRQLQLRKIDPAKYQAANASILYPKWTKTHYKGGIGEYARLEQARKINADAPATEAALPWFAAISSPLAANASASWGMFQIMGFQYQLCGFKTVAQFVSAMCQSERSQLLAFCRFITKNPQMHAALQAKKWATFARLYNGSEYAKNQYDTKLLNAYKAYAAK